MTDQFFELKSPKDMFEKAKREFQRMESDLNTDSIFNFFVTTYHIIDYVRNHQPPVQETEINSMARDADFHACDFLCNKGKHLILTKKKWTQKPQPTTKHNFGSMCGASMYNKAKYNESESYSLVVDGKEIDVSALGRRLLEKWETFLQRNQLA